MWISIFPRWVILHLRPQFTTNYEANISVDERPLLAIGYNKTKDIFTNVIYQADSSTSVAYRTYDNLGTNKEIYLRGLGAIPPGKKYFFVLGANTITIFMMDCMKANRFPFKEEPGLFLPIISSNWISVHKLLSMALYVSMVSSSFMNLSTFGALNTSINRQFMKQKLIVTLSMNDIFYTNQNDFTINQGSVNAYGNRRSDTRRVGINIRYNFGIRKKEEGNDMFNVEGQDK